MIKTINTLILFLILIVSCAQQKSEVDAVKKAFENYKSNILNGNGEEAVKYVDSRTIKYYNDALNLIKNADSIEINQLSLLDKIMALSVRHKASREEILSFDGKGLFMYAIKSGMVGKNSVSNNSIGEVSIDKDFAKAQLVVSGKATQFYFHFYKEEGLWKIDLTSAFPVSMVALKKVIKDSGHDENDFLLALLEMTSGKKPGREIWMKVE